MLPDEAEFHARAAAVVRRWCQQTDTPPPSNVDVAAFVARLWTLVAERGLPPPPTAGVVGAPREMSEAESAPLVERLLVGDAETKWGDLARQLLKACFYPEFTTCRDSFRAVSPDGACRRQERGRAAKRISGSHCVDCPYWLSHEAGTHATLLREAWCGDPTAFDQDRDVFLPEDYRALRRWIRARARSSAPFL